MTPDNVEVQVTLTLEVTEDPQLKQYDRLVALDGTKWQVAAVTRREVPPYAMVNPPPPAPIWWEVKVVAIDPSLVLARKRPKLSELALHAMTFEKQGAQRPAPAPAPAVSGLCQRDSDCYMADGHTGECGGNMDDGG